jgi:hypothetical protein
MQNWNQNSIIELGVDGARRLLLAASSHPSVLKVDISTNHP